MQGEETEIAKAKRKKVDKDQCQTVKDQLISCSTNFHTYNTIVIDIGKHEFPKSMNTY